MHHVEQACLHCARLLPEACMAQKNVALLCLGGCCHGLELSEIHFWTHCWNHLFGVLQALTSLANRRMMDTGALNSICAAWCVEGPFLCQAMATARLRHCEAAHLRSARQHMRNHKHIGRSQLQDVTKDTRCLARAT